jgi:hypothetical protein
MKKKQIINTKDSRTYHVGSLKYDFESLFENNDFYNNNEVFNINYFTFHVELPCDNGEVCTDTFNVKEIVTQNKLNDLVLSIVLDKHFETRFNSVIDVENYLKMFLDDYILFSYSKKVNKFFIVKPEQVIKNAETYFLFASLANEPLQELEEKGEIVDIILDTVEECLGDNTLGCIGIDGKTWFNIYKTEDKGLIFNETFDDFYDTLFKEFNKRKNQPTYIFIKVVTNPEISLDEQYLEFYGICCLKNNTNEYEIGFVSAEDLKQCVKPNGDKIIYCDLEGNKIN